MQTVQTDFLKDCAALTLTIRAWGNRRQGDMDKVSTDADKTRLKLAKQLIVSKEYEAVVSYLNETRAWILGRTMPFPGFKKGIYLARLSTVTMVEKELPKRIAELNKLVAAFVAAYPAQVQDAEQKLNGQFKASDYPTSNELFSRFGVSWNWLAFTVPENLPAEIREAEAKKLEAKFADAGEEILIALREGFQKLVSHAVERLTVAPGEKEKVFRDTLIGNIQEFIETFSARNLMNDADLESLVSKAKGVLTGVTPDALRDNASLRDKTRTAFETVKTELDKMIVERPSRKFSFDE